MNSLDLDLILFYKEQLAFYRNEMELSTTEKEYEIAEQLVERTVSDLRILEEV